MWKPRRPLRYRAARLAGGVASNRLEGATPAAVVEFVGIDHRITYPATQPFTVEGDQ